MATGIVQQLKAFDSARQGTSFDDLVGLSITGKLMIDGYGRLDMEPPAWLEDVLIGIDAEIKNRRRDQLERELREAELSVSRLKTREERRADQTTRIERLRKQLGKA